MTVPVNPTATAVTFSFSWAGTYQTAGHDRFDLYARAQYLPSRGYAIRTNGLDPNCKVDPDVGISDLLLRAPRDEAYPAVTAIPSVTGKIFGNGYKWRVRYRNLKTGETSGLSPIPSMGYNLGVATTVGGASWLGQTAYFMIPGVATTYGVDTIDLCRNTDSGTVWYVVDSKSNPGAGATVRFEDNVPDEEMWNLVQTDLSINPSYYTPHPPPCVRSYQHSSGAVWLYGHMNMGTYNAGTASIAADGNVVTGTNSKWYRGREGQGIRWTTDPDRTLFRIAEVTDLTEMYVTPKAPATLTGAYEIVDDIDGRNIYILDPISPAQHDPLNILSVGQDRSDGVMFIEGLGGTTYVFTRSHIYGLSNDHTTDPVLDIEVQPIANVGVCGFWAACKTPFGIVFVDKDHGVMVFDGQSPPRNLGSETALIDFQPKTQFLDFDRGMLSEVYCAWDPEARRVFVSYCPTGVMASIRRLSFDPTAGNGGNWRGPWRGPVYSAGIIHNATGKDVFLQGDLFGSLYLEGDIAQDQIVAPVAGTISTVDSQTQITTTAGIIATNMVGAPILFSDGAGNYYLNWIAKRIATNKALLLLVPSTTLVTGWTFQIGVIHWQAKTAFIDASDPGQPKSIRELMIGYDRISNGVDSVVVDAVSEGVTITESADTVAVVAPFTQTSTGGLIKATAGVNVGGTAVTLRFSGRASYGNPQITKVLAHLQVYGGNADPTTGDRKKTVITTTVTS